MARFGRSYPAQRIWTPPSHAVSPVAFDSIGNGNDPASTAKTSLTWTHTATAGAYVLAMINGFDNYQQPTTANYGSTAMTYLGRSASSSCFNFIWVLANAPGGSQTVTISGSNSTEITGNSVSYKNVVSVGTPTLAEGSASTSLSQAYTCSPGQMIVNAFGVPAYPITSPTGGTTRFNLGNASTGSAFLLLQDSTVSTTFGATIGTATQYTIFGIVLSNH